MTRVEPKVAGASPTDAVNTSMSPAPLLALDSAGRQTGVTT
ncbi:hypothetical protein ACVLV4_001600 [Rathayibacter agropyri]